MTHAWMNVLAAIAISLQTGAVSMRGVSDDALQLEAIEINAGDEEESEPLRKPHNYVVVERIGDDLAYLETPQGKLVLPLYYLPADVAEGTVIEYRIATDEAARRLDLARARIERLQQLSATP